MVKNEIICQRITFFPIFNKNFTIIASFQGAKGFFSWIIGHC
ncbi:hypothetical protein VL20_5587 [Microcystis panniformis FACHB-1757]|uniref:Uncharacterized protein n=1 Tax=Microcystis panniformis FACHB-1757 TaxID=1638788 RepID=A0A0K1S8F4_9CHRO|nr:hypothetical protein VL20_5587 [Microcystis panniformis FACHB-1757]